MATTVGGTRGCRADCVIMWSISDTECVFLCPTDTIYGLSARVNDIDAVKRIAELKGRVQTCGFITLIPDIDALVQFGVELLPRHRAILEKLWPGPVTVVLKADTAAWAHLAGGKETLAFRVPDYPELRGFLHEVGPIVSTSANKHGETPAKTSDEVRAMFGDAVDAYIDVGPRTGEASTIIQILR